MRVGTARKSDLRDMLDVPASWDSSVDPTVCMLTPFKSNFNKLKCCESLIRSAEWSDEMLLSPTC